MQCSAVQCTHAQNGDVVRISETFLQIRNNGSLFSVPVADTGYRRYRLLRTTQVSLGATLLGNKEDAWWAADSRGVWRSEQSWTANWYGIASVL